MNICIIPARGGSKRLKDKNIKEVNGIPIINHVIDKVFLASIFDLVIVSTDSEKIVNAVSKNKNYYKVSIHSRSKINSSDTATLSDIVREVSFSYKFKDEDYIFLILPTAILVNELDIYLSNPRGIKDYNIMSVIRTPQPVDRILKIEDGVLKFCSPEKKSVRTQDVPESYFDAGQFYWVNKALFDKENEIITSKCKPFFIDDMECQDIDTELDWNKMIIKYNIKQNGKFFT